MKQITIHEANNRERKLVTLIWDSSIAPGDLVEYVHGLFIMTAEEAGYRVAFDLCEILENQEAA